MSRAPMIIAPPLAAALLYLAAAAGASPEECTLDEVIFGKQITGPTITEDDCRGRVTVFFTWGIT